MDLTFKQQFIELWNEYFPSTELPIVFYYTNQETKSELAQAPAVHRCVICDLTAVRQGTCRVFSVATIGCSGGKRYLGFSHELRPEFNYFLSCGIPGKLKGERYKKTPELVEQAMQYQPPFQAPEKYIVVKRWDHLVATDQPLVVIFFAGPTVLSGLFTLANYAVAHPYGVIAPFGAGCASIVAYPYHESQSENPRAVLGMFDVSARPCVPAHMLTFAVPWKKFVQMVDDMTESFLITESWKKVKENQLPIA